MNQGLGAAEIYHLMGGEVKRKSVESILRTYFQTGRTSPKKKGGSKRKKMCDEHEEFIEEAQEERHSKTYLQISQEYQEKFGEKISLESISRVLKKRRFSTKMMISVPAERNTRENIAKRKVFAQEMGHIPEERLVYIDESPFNLHMNRKRGRSKKGRRAYNEVKGSRGANITVLAAFSASHGLIKYIAQTGSFTQESYNAFSKNYYVNHQLNAAVAYFFMTTHLSTNPNFTRNFRRTTDPTSNKIHPSVFSSPPSYRNMLQYLEKST